MSINIAICRNKHAFKRIYLLIYSLLNIALLYYICKTYIITI